MPRPKLMLIGSLLKNAASLDDDRVAQQVLAERGLAADRRCRPAGTTGRCRSGGRLPLDLDRQQLAIGPGEHHRRRRPAAGRSSPQFGSNVSWSMIVWRAYWRAEPSPRLPRVAEEQRADDLVRQLLAELDGLERDVDVDGLRRARGRTAWRPCRRARRPVPGASASDAFVDGAPEPAVLEPQVGLDERHGRPRSPPGSSAATRSRRRGRGRATDRPGATSRLDAVPSPRKSPLTGEDSSAPPGTRSWYVPRVGEKTPR